jgi:hypothetical protein
MTNEGVIVSDAKSLVKSEMLRQLWKLGPTTPEAWERHVFQALTGASRDDVDWSVEDNQAGFFLWIKGFDGLVQELVEDGYVLEEAEGTRKVLAPVEADPPLDVSLLAYPRQARG